MKTLICDICGTQVSRNEDLIPLLQEYETDDIKHLCHACVKQVNDAREKVRQMLTKPLFPLVKRFMTELKRKLGGAA